MSKILSQKELLQKIKELQVGGTVDLSTEEDLSIAIMNLVSLEEHYFFTAKRTEKAEYLDFLLEVRKIRKELLAKLIPQNEGETWCLAKHLLAASMRLFEVGAKLKSHREQKEAEEMFNKAYELYSLFWALRLKLTSSKELNKQVANIKDGGPWTIQEIVTRLVDCCKE